MSEKKPVLQYISIERLIRGRYQPRKSFPPDKLQELAESIKSTGGLLQPIVVRATADQRYEIIAGERRWRAAQLAGLSEVSCLIFQFSDEQVLQAGLIENINRDNLNPIEEAQAYQRLIDEFDYMHEEVAAMLGKSRAAITNSLRLLRLAPAVQQYLIQEQLTEGHGKILASLATQDQIDLAQQCVQKNWNVRKLEAEIKKRQQAADLPPSHYSDANIQHLETALSSHLGNRVQIEYEARGGGYMKIRFNNIDELEGHFQQIGFDLGKID